MTDWAAAAVRDAPREGSKVTVDGRTVAADRAAQHGTHAARSGRARHPARGVPADGARCPSEGTRHRRLPQRGHRLRPRLARDHRPRRPDDAHRLGRTARSRSRHELTSYPKELLSSPADTAHRLAAGPRPAAPPSSRSGADAPAASVLPRGADRWTQALNSLVARHDLTVRLRRAGPASSRSSSARCTRSRPGHGKTLMAATAAARGRQGPAEGRPAAGRLGDGHPHPGRGRARPAGHGGLGGGALGDRLAGRRERGPGDGGGRSPSCAGPCAPAPPARAHAMPRTHAPRRTHRIRTTTTTRTHDDSHGHTTTTSTATARPRPPARHGDRRARTGPRRTPSHGTHAHGRHRAARRHHAARDTTTTHDHGHEHHRRPRSRPRPHDAPRPQARHHPRRRTHPRRLHPHPRRSPPPSAARSCSASPVGWCPARPPSSCSSAPPRSGRPGSGCCSCVAYGVGLALTLTAAGFAVVKLGSGVDTGCWTGAGAGRRPGGHAPGRAGPRPWRRRSSSWLSGPDWCSRGRHPHSAELLLGRIACDITRSGDFARMRMGDARVRRTGQ